MKSFHLLAIAVCVLAEIWTAHVAKAQEHLITPQQKTQLAYSFTPGQINRYKIVQKMKGTRTITGSSPTDLDMQLTSIIRMRCTKVLDGNIFELAIDTEDEYMKISGKAVYGYKPSQEIRTIQINQNGNIVGSQPSSSQEPKRRHALDFWAVESILLMCILPDKPVAVRDGWSAEIPLPIPVDKKSKLKLDFQLTEVKTSSDITTATIKQKLTTPLNESNESQENLPKGSQSGESTLIFDISNGRLTSANGTIRTKIETRVSVPMAPGYTNSQPVQTFDVTTNYTVELLPEQKKSQ